MYNQLVKPEESRSVEDTEQPTQHKSYRRPVEQFTKSQPTSRDAWSGLSVMSSGSLTGDAIQRRDNTIDFGGQDLPVQRTANITGLPDGLRSGMEAVSGYDLSHVNVHYNSPKPAAVQAHAYAQGSDIHLGAGQERHLPHELGHVVQQIRGDVKVTRQFAGVGINDDVGLERGADRLGEMALQRVSYTGNTHSDKSITLTPSVKAFQKKTDPYSAELDSQNGVRIPIQRKLFIGGREEPETIDSVRDHIKELDPDEKKEIYKMVNSSDTRYVYEDLAQLIKNFQDAVIRRGDHKHEISERSGAPFSERDPMTYEEAREVFDTSAQQFRDILSEGKAIKAGFSGIIHFGTNVTRLDTAGIAAKPHAKGRYGGTELTSSNNQAMVTRINKNRQIRLATSQVRPGVNNANISIARLEVALIHKELIYFHLNQFNEDIIKALVEDNPEYTTTSGFTPVKSVTGQEFIHIYKNWTKFSNSVVFLRNLKPTHKPWKSA